ncbi:hypothetical protein AM593_00890, partial [Mytilus galloprovincialis]
MTKNGSTTDTLQLYELKNKEILPQELIMRCSHNNTIKVCERHLMVFDEVIMKSSGSGGSNVKRLPHDMNKKSLTKLYNSEVTKVESVSSKTNVIIFSRPLSGFFGKIGIKHTGVVATTKNGGKFLVHKGSGYGKSSSTIVVNAKHMSNK